MFKIIGNDIYLSKGNTATIAVKIRDTDGSPFALGEFDDLVFTVKKNTTDTTYRIKKTRSNGDFTEATDTIAGQEIKRYVCELSVEDTSNIEECGAYVYDVRLDYTVQGVSGKKHCTLIPPSKFYIEEVVSDIEEEGGEEE